LFKWAAAPKAAKAAELCDLFCGGTRRRIADHFRAIRDNDDVAKYATARRVLEGEYAWLEEGLAPMEGASARISAEPPQPTRAASR
jgi:hypothetical protein